MLRRMDKGSEESPDWRRYLKRCAKPAAYALVLMAVSVIVWAIVVWLLLKCK